MNGQKAKALRRRIYGDNSLRAPREYVGIENGAHWIGGAVHRLFQIINAPGSLRARYQAAKRAAK